MTKLMKTTSLAALLLLFSGCSNVLNNLNTPIKPKIDDSIEIVEQNSIKTISDITSIAFEWKKVEDPRVVGYNFYRADIQKEGNSLKLIETINNRYATHFVDSGLEPNTKYAYQISSKTEQGTESKTTDAYVAQTLPRIVPISFVQAISNLPNRVKLTWRPHPDNRVEYYRIEKFNTTLNEWIYLKTINERLLAEYIDTGLDNNTSYKYRVKAFTFNDVESAPSQAVVAKTKPLPIDALNIRASDNQPRRVVLIWEASPTTDVVKYEVHRSIFSSLGYSKIATVDSNTFEFIDKIDSDGKSYYYKVIAVDKDNLESPSKQDPVKGTTLDKPARPIMTLAQIQGNKAILNWRAGDDRAISYNVYKKIKINFFESKTLKFNNITNLRFEDNDIVSGVEYKYSVESNDDFGLVSEKTDEASLILPQLKTIQ